MSVTCDIALFAFLGLPAPGIPLATRNSRANAVSPNCRVSRCADFFEIPIAAPAHVMLPRDCSSAARQLASLKARTAEGQWAGGARAHGVFLSSQQSQTGSV